MLATKMITQPSPQGTNITVMGMTCIGGHGLSIGSVGSKSDNTITDIIFSNSTISNSENGCRIKPTLEQ
jgi:polygalacturonase